MSAFDSPRERKSYIGLKTRPKHSKEFIVLFGLGTVYAGKYSVIDGKSKDEALINAYLKYGRRNVISVTALNDQSIAVQEMYGRERI